MCYVACGSIVRVAGIVVGGGMALPEKDGWWPWIILMLIVWGLVLYWGLGGFE